MKKLIATMMILAMLIPFGALACEEISPILPSIETAEGVYTGPAWWALCDETHLIFGKLNPEETLAVYPVQNVDGAYIRGAVDNGMIRQKGEARFLALGETVCGLTKIDVTVSINAEYMDTVSRIVRRRTDDETAVSAASIIACTMGRTDSTVYHYIFPEAADKAVIGCIAFNGGKSRATLYLGDWNGDGLYDLGFAAGYIVNEPKEPEKQEEPEPAHEPVCPIIVEKTVYAQPKTCVKIIQINNQININSTVTNCQRVNIGGGCGKERVQCVKE